MPVLLFMRWTPVTTNGRGKKPLTRQTLALLQWDSVNALLRVAQVAIALSLTPTP
jgi:hypothetical protein